MNILGWEHWAVTRGQQKGPDYTLEAEYQLRPPVCLRCGVDAPRLESCGILRVTVKDDLIHGRRVQIIVSKRQWKCRECEKTFVEQPPEIDEKRRMTKRLLTTLQRKSFERPFAEIAADYGVNEATIREVFHEELARRNKDWEFEPPEILGIDEVHLEKKRFVAVNLGTQPSALVEMLEDRKQATVERFFSTAKWKGRVRVVAMDMWNPYRNAVQKELPRRGHRGRRFSRRADCQPYR